MPLKDDQHIVKQKFHEAFCRYSILFGSWRVRVHMGDHLQELGEGETRSDAWAEAARRLEREE